jgi:hypothetical protein
VLQAGRSLGSSKRVVLERPPSVNLHSSSWQLGTLLKVCSRHMKLRVGGGGGLELG